tara:strand:- start:552 stop:716 length:165 start_codon:yes stop_codon:yes gene_type:complete
MRRNIRNETIHEALWELYQSNGLAGDLVRGVIKGQIASGKLKIGGEKNETTIDT